MTMTQDQVLDLMLGAMDKKQVRAAWSAARAYLKDHPDDETILTAGESLAMLEDALNNPDPEEETANV